MANPVKTAEKANAGEILDSIAQTPPASGAPKPEAIIEFLRQRNEYVKTIEIARQFYGAGATRKSINPQLYELLKQKRVSKTAKDNGGDPRWKAV